jgi:DNA polymerase
VDPSLAREARSIAASARALLEELAEEGLERIPPVAPEPVAVRAPDVAPTVGSHEDAPIAERSEEPASEVPPPAPPPPSVTAQIDLGGVESPWGDLPTLEAVREALGDCKRCGLCEGRSKIVFGDGNPDADLMFVGEGPGADEDRQGIPFVGRAGQLLTAMIEKGLEIPRSDVYICNIVKCRPPGNRTPLADEVSTCRPFLDGQIQAVRPRVIVALGRPAASLLLGRDVSITRIRGTWQAYGDIPLMPTLHPAFVLRQYTPENRRHVWEDLKAALERARG